MRSIAAARWRMANSLTKGTHVWQQIRARVPGDTHQPAGQIWLLAEERKYKPVLGGCLAQAIVHFPTSSCAGHQRGRLDAQSSRAGVSQPFRFDLARWIAFQAACCEGIW